MRLLPRDEKFFEMLLSQARVVLDAASELERGIKAGNSALRQTAEKVAALEKEGDELLHHVFDRLNKTFLTPIDPEDVHAICTGLDEILDHVEATAFRLSAYRIDPLPEAMTRMARLIRQCNEALVRAFEILKEKEMDGKEEVHQQCIETNRYESESEQIAREELRALFENEKDAVQLLKLKDMYESLEATADCCEDVADILENVVARNS